MREDPDGRAPIVAAAIACIAMTFPFAMRAARADELAPASTMQPQALEIASVDVSGHPQMSAVLRVPPALQDRALAQDAFAIDEGGENRPVKVEKLPATGLEVVLAIDTSGSMRGAALAAAKSAAQRFVTSLPADAHVAVVAFGARPAVIADFSAPRARAVQDIAGLRARGETAVYDAVITATKLFTPWSTRRVVTLVADGGDTVSKQPLTAAARALSDGKIGMYTVSLQTSESDPASLRALAAAGNGRMVPAADPIALDGVLHAVGQLVANEYRVRWTASHEGTNRIVATVTADGTAYRAERTVDYPVLAPPAPGDRTAPVTAPRPVVAAATSTHAATVWLVVGLAASFLSLALVFGFVLVPSRPTRRLAREWLPHLPEHELTSLTRRASSFGEDVLERTGQVDWVTRLLERAAITIPAGQALVVVAVFAVVAFLFGTVLAGLVTGVGLAALVVAALVAYAHLRADRRKNRFAEQFESTLQLLSSSLRAGYGLNQALDTVGREGESPTKEEFRRVALETRLGKDQIQAMREAADRVQSVDFDWVIDAMDINREIGGNLSEVLQNVAATIRERTRLGRQVRSLSAEGRASAAVLLALPPAMFVWMRIANPDYTRELTGTSKGHVLLAAGFVLLGAGMAWMRKIIRIQY